MQRKSYDLTILVPVYNEEASLPFLLKKLSKVNFKKKPQLIIVNDGSKDKSQEIIDSWIKDKKLFFDIEAITHKKNKGKGAGIQTGLKKAKGKYFVVQDADLEYEPSEIPKLLDVALSTKSPVVYGSRFMGSIRNMPLPNYYANRFYNILLRVLYGVKMTDMHTCYKMVETKLFKELKIKSLGFGYAPELISKLLLRKVPIVEIPISYNGRTVDEGKKINIADGIDCLSQLIRYRIMGEKK